MKTLRIFLMVLLGLQFALLNAQQVPGALTWKDVQEQGQSYSPRNDNGGLMTCPSTSFWSQTPVDPLGSWTFLNSDAQGGYLAYDNFSGLTAPIKTVRFWGINAYYLSGFTFCETEDPMTFDIVFYQDNAGTPGAVVASYNFTLDRIPTGASYSGFQHYLYIANLPASLNISEGWISIQGVSISDPDCWFLWGNSFDGDLYCLQKDQSSGIFSARDFDLSLCFDSSPMVPLSNWAVLTGLLLIVTIVIFRFRRI